MEDTNRIVSNDFKEISIFSVNGKAAGFELRANPQEESDKDFFADNEEYIYAVFKVLNRANERGWFDHLKKEDEVEEVREYV